MTPQFVDISRWQGEIDFVAYADWARQWDGIARIAMKSSEGVGFTDPRFQANRAKALAAGIDCIYYYHFARPDLNSAIAEANSQFSIVGSIRPQDIVILDFEEDVSQATATWALTWLQAQEANYGKLPGIYASEAYIQERLQDARLARYQLWLAKWEFTPDERPTCPAPWQSYEFVQYTDKGAGIPGINSTVDVNVFLPIGGNRPMPQTTIDLSNGTVASHFTGSDNTIWQCKENGFLVGHAILDFYRYYGGNALCGLTYLGLPTMNEKGVTGYSGVVYQRFERGVLVYDPQHALDNPPGSGSVYLAHIDSGIGIDPRIGPLQTQIALLKSQVADLQSQLDTNVQAQENAILLAKIAQAQKDLA